MFYPDPSSVRGVIIVHPGIRNMMVFPELLPSLDLDDSGKHQIKAAIEFLTRDANPKDLRFTYRSGIDANLEPKPYGRLLIAFLAAKNYVVGEHRQGVSDHDDAHDRRYR